MNIPTLFMLNTWYDAPGSGPFYCPDCGVVEGFFLYNPDIKNRMDIIYVDFQRPRRPIIEQLGGENQGSPVLVLQGPDPSFKSIKKSLTTGKSFIDDPIAICDYLAKIFDGARPHPKGLDTTTGPVVKIRLRDTCEKDIDHILAMERDPENTPFIRQWTRQQHIESLSSSHYGHFIIQGPSDEIMGYIILTGLDNPDKSIEFKRIVIRAKGTGQGKQAVSLAVNKVFKELGAHRLWLEVLPTNKRALAVYTACGFVKEGVHRESVKMDNQFLSLDVMSILRHETNT